VQHRFVTELFAGTIPDRVMAGYLIQDHRFLDSFLTRCSARPSPPPTASSAAALRPLRRHGVGREHLFPARFQEALDYRRNSAPKCGPKPTAGFKAIMREASTTRSYAAALSVLNVAEWLYLDWAMKVPQPCQRILCMPNGSPCTIIPTSATSWLSCARSWIVSARRREDQ
jgi:thiaminase/transcriptional activator TenA